MPHSYDNIVEDIKLKPDRMKFCLGQGQCWSGLHLPQSIKLRQVQGKCKAKQKARARHYGR